MIEDTVLNTGSKSFEMKDGCIHMLKRTVTLGLAYTNIFISLYSPYDQLFIIVTRMRQTYLLLNIRYQLLK